MKYEGLVSTDQLLSGTVRDQLGDEYGQVKELLVDPATGKIALAVLGFGGVLGIGDTTKLIPWSALQPNPNTHEFVLDMDRKLLEGAPEMGAKDIIDRQKLGELYRYYGYPAYWEDNVNYDTSDPVYKAEKPRDHQQSEGSYQITEPHNNPEENNHMADEVDLDKITGNRPAGRS